MSVIAVKRAIDGFSEMLISESVANDHVPSEVIYLRQKDIYARVTWQQSKPETFRLVGQTVEDYLFCIEYRQYTSLLRDGSFIQVTYDFDERQHLSGHRLVYWPSPVDSLDLDEFPEFTPLETLRMVWDEAKLAPESLRLRGPWRMDFDPGAASDTHPETHLSVLHSDCRVPITRPIDLRRFSELVFQHLHTARHVECRDWADPVPELPTLADLRTLPTQESLHLHWRDPY